MFCKAWYGVKHTHTHTDTQTHRHTDTQTQTHRHTDTQTHRHTHTHTHTHTYTTQSISIMRGACKFTGHSFMNKNGGYTMNVGGRECRGEFAAILS